jgi:hypothetical protein
MNASNLVTVAIADLWKRTRPKERRVFEEAAARDMDRFKAEMAAYKRRQQQLMEQQQQQQPPQQQPEPQQAPPSPPAQLLSPLPPPMPPRPQKKPAAAAQKRAHPQLRVSKEGKGAAAIGVAGSGNGASPSLPRKPPGAFLLWSHKPRGELRRQKDPQLDNGAVSRILGTRWRGLSAEEKAPWIQLASNQLDAYLEEKRRVLEAAGIPTAPSNRKRRKTGAGAAAATTAAARAPSVSSVASSPTAAAASTMAATAAALRLPTKPQLFKGPAPEEKAEQMVEEREAGRPQPFWAVGGYGATGAGFAEAEQQQQQQLVGGMAEEEEEDEDGAFESAVLCDQNTGAFLLDMDFSDIADEIWLEGGQDGCGWM